MIIPYIDNNYFLLFPRIPANCDKPPTVYAILESIVNYGKEEKTKIRDLAKVGRETIFNFDYPLSQNVSRETFETMILNHFLMRRIGFETVEAFRIQLMVKLNEIMPMYNIMFDSIQNWNLFQEGEITRRYGTDNRQVETNSNTKNELENTSQNKTQNISDRRNSQLPQNQLQDLRDGDYVTDYNYDTNNTNSNDKSNSNGKSESQNNTKDNNQYNETIEKSPANKLELLKEFQENIKNVYGMIFKDLECLFYQLV